MVCCEYRVLLCIVSRVVQSIVNGFVCHGVIRVVYCIVSKVLLVCCDKFCTVCCE